MEAQRRLAYQLLVTTPVTFRRAMLPASVAFAALDSKTVPCLNAAFRKGAASSAAALKSEALLGQHLELNLQRDGFAVDQDTIAIEDDRLEAQN